ncbi:MAG TPA: nuclear transport factor 2 family protein [Rugosimonospora sp.]|nr:nuclear transport factor 2 family protein [Rugosimonospora sp.]
MIESPYISWTAPDGDNPARLASQRSYDAVGRKAKDEWLALFADDAVLQDPAGPSMFDESGDGHRGRAAIGAFWDTAIAPVRSFHFTVTDSFANGPYCANVATFSTVLPDGSQVDTELVATYQLGADGRIATMRAYWELERALATLHRP